MPSIDADDDEDESKKGLSTPPPQALLAHENVWQAVQLSLPCQNGLCCCLHHCAHHRPQDPHSQLAKSVL